MREAINHGRLTEFRGSAAYARKALAEGAHLSKLELLRCLTRYFTDGLILSSKRFAEGVFGEQRAKFSPKRNTAARALKVGAAWGELRVFWYLER